MVSRSLGIALLLLAPALLAGKCGGGNGSGGDPAVVEITSPDSRCVALPDAFGNPPGYDFVPGRSGRVLAATFTEPTLVPLNVARVPFRVPRNADPYTLPSDADGDGRPEPVQPIDDVFALDRNLALVTLSTYEAVLFVDPQGGAREVVLETPPPPGVGFDRTEEIDPDELLLWPPSGTAERRTGFANFPCIVPRSGARDSRGDLLREVLPETPGCPTGIESYRGSFTSGVASAAGRLFVSMSNLGDDQGADDTQYLPAAIAVYAFDESRSRPRITPIATPDGGAFLRTGSSGFNATHVQRYVTPSGRELILATLSGAIGIREDDPDTDEFESGAVRITSGSIEVFDPIALQRVARYPLEGANPSFNGLAIDPDGEVAAVGDVTDRLLYAVDLRPLDALPDPAIPGARVAVLDGPALLFDGDSPLKIPSLPNGTGAPEETCPGWIESVAWNDAGDRLYALDVCDGSITGIGVDLSGGPDPDLFFVGATEPVTAPLRSDSAGRPRRPAKLQVRPGEPGRDYDGPDLFFLVNEPEGLLCGIRVESPEPR